MYWHFLQGNLLGTTIETDTAKTCQEKCKNRQDCQWYSYNKKLEVCAHFDTCTAMNDQTDYVSSQSQCSDSNHELEDKKFDNPDVDVIALFLSLLDNGKCLLVFGN